MAASPTATITPFVRRTNECDALFHALLETPKRDADIKQNVHRLLERFNRWAGYLGVFAPEEACLDSRLRLDEHTRDLVNRLIDILVYNLRLALNLTSASTDVSEHLDMDHSSRIASIEAALQGVEGVLDRLHRVGNAIRRASATNLNSRVERFARKGESHQSMLQDFERLVIRGLYPTMPEEFQNHLAKSITFRRQRLEYQREHKEYLKSKTVLKTTQPQEESTQSQGNRIDVQWKMPLMSTIVGKIKGKVSEGKHPHGSNPRALPTASIRTHESIIDPGQLNIQERIETQSSFTPSTTTVARNEPYPVPKYPEGQQHHECEWCGEELPVPNTKNLWKDVFRSHFIRDLKPYVCLSSDCHVEPVYFNTKKQWLYHMSSKHGTGWPQDIFKPTIWYCDSDEHPGEQYLEFGSPQELLEHLMTSEHTIPPEKREQLVTRNSMLMPRGITICPICNEDVTASQQLEDGMKENVKEVASGKTAKFDVPSHQSDSEDEEVGSGTYQSTWEGQDVLDPLNDPISSSAFRVKLHNHIAQHVKSLAFQSLRYFDDQPVSTDSNDGKFEKQANASSQSRAQFWSDSPLSFASQYSQTSSNPAQAVRITPEPFPQVISKIRGLIKQSLIPDCYSGKDFLPINEIAKIATRENVTAVLQAQGLAYTEALTNWVVKDAQKLFLILVRMTTAREIPHDRPVGLLRDLMYHGLKDKLLPVHLSGLVGVAAEKREEEGQEFPIFASWDVNNRQLFEMHQWMVMAPVFSHRSPFYSNFNTSRRLPWLSQENKAAGAGYFGEVTQVEMHRDHVPDLSQLDPKIKGVAVAVKKANYGVKQADFFDKEIGNLLKIRDYDHPHVVKPIAAYQIHDNRYLLFPWAAGGNLDAVWQDNDTLRQDPKKVKWLLDQVSGLLAALKYIHHTQGGRHGNLKPENILCFVDRDGRETLQIADMGLTLFESDMVLASEDMRARRRKELLLDRMPPNRMFRGYRYAAPDPNIFPSHSISRGYDIWSMGCILLELLIWLTSGFEAVLAYRVEIPDIWEKQGDEYRLHPNVVSIMETMEADLEANTVYRDIFELVKKRMLVIALPVGYGFSSAGCRDCAKVVSEEIERIQARCTSKEYMRPITLEYTLI